MKSLIRCDCLKGSKDIISLKKLTIGLSKVSILLLQLVVKFLPTLVKVLPVVFVLFNSEDLLLDWVHSESLLECEWIDFFKDSFQSDETFLKDSVEKLDSKRFITCASGYQPSQR